MIKIGKEAFFSPVVIFFVYIIVSALGIMVFRFILPGEAVPLACFSWSWRLIRGIVDYLNLFPALVLSALVIPFGFKIQAQEKINPFSPQFLQSLRASIITVIIAAVLYSLISFLLLPLSRDYEAKLRFQGRLYGLAKDRAQKHAAKGEWTEAAQFVGVCERIWPNGSEISKLKTDVEIQSETERLSSGNRSGKLSEANAGTNGTTSGLPLPGLSLGRQPVNAAEALNLAETALGEGRFFDAHWLATLGGRLAKPGSVEEANARRLAGRAWNGVNSLAPNARETKAYTIFRLKREGYEALVAEEWIRSYYIFRDLIALSPDDPDAVKYLALSEKGVHQAAFFTDEMELTLGSILTGAVFSMPMGTGRLVMRVASLSTSADTAYGIGTEIMVFDRNGRPLWSMEAPYAKMFPLSRESGPAVVVLLRALDRQDKTKRWEPVVKGSTPNGAAGNAEIALQVSWENFLLLSELPRGLSGLSPAGLKRASGDLGNYGYQPKVFQAELLRRFAEPLLLLPLGIFAIVIGWRYRALKRPRYVGIPMLIMLPAVFNGAMLFCRELVSNLGVWAVVSLGFTVAAIVFAGGLIVLLVLSLILLSAQHG
ncbi:MAG: hypothetical protein FWC45_03255 [Treponema sp.]|nr:hypothetical protein [Treponema sp.]